MSVSEWVNVVGLAVAVFAAAWTVIRETTTPGRSHVISATVALAAGLVVTSAYGIEKGTAHYLRSAMREDVLELLGGSSKYFWTFDDLLDIEQQQHRLLWNEIALGPILQAVLNELTEERKIKAPIARWYYPQPPEPHDVTVYCKDCKI